MITSPLFFREKAFILLLTALLLSILLVPGQRELKTLSFREKTGTRNYQQDTSPKYLPKGKPALIEFVSASCKFSQQMKPLVEELKKKYSSEVNFRILDVDSKEGKKEKEKYGDVPTPTFIFVNARGERTAKIIGAMPKEQLEEAIGETLPADSPLKKALLEREENSESNPAPTIDSIKPVSVSACD